MNTTRIEFWYAIGSTYTYLTVMRISQRCKDAGVELSWHPFNIRELMMETNNLPFPDSKPAKQKYMWRDLQRRAEMYGLPIKMPVTYPLESFDTANRIAILASNEGWCEDYTVATYKYWFEYGFPAGGEENVTRTLGELGRSGDGVLDRIDSSDVTNAYARNTERARELGVFGAPSFINDGELFWGDDRLEDALRV